MNGNGRHPGYPPSTTQILLSVQLSTKYKIRMSNLCAQHDTVADFISGCWTLLNLLSNALTQLQLPPTPCSNTGLCLHGDPVFLHFWAFFGTTVFAIQ